ncbi:hypothetical protein HDU76_002311 [Blyttiomyces sp. JEL0837]|nr:hypothetical protein HDU76_002311 [Blyttiomyces sp. JEL0837]
MSTHHHDRHDQHQHSDGMGHAGHMQNNHDGPMPTEAELNDIRKALERLWTLDTNRLKPGKDFALNLQGQTHGKADSNYEIFLKEMKRVWFELYRRVVNNDSSAFEHTFVGEIKGSEVIGFHNWITFLREEKAHRADFRGFILPKNKSGVGAHPTGNEHVLSFQLSWKGDLKPVSTFLIGTSPEYEFALFTMVFLCSGTGVAGLNGGGDGRERIEVDGVECDVVVHRFNSAYHGVRIGSSYVEIIE